MKSTKEIGDKLKAVRKELDYINSHITDGLHQIEDQYVYPDGSVSKVEGYTFQRAVTVLVAEKHLLHWILDKDLTNND
jgi:uncharacterized protein YggE